MRREDAGHELEKAAEALGLQLDAGQMSRLLDLLDMLSKWNRVYNLTAIRDRAEMLRQHLIDSLSVVPPLQRYLLQCSESAPHLFDVGSGAGFPGLVIGIAMPNVKVTCVDSVGKKVGFIRQALAELKLENVQAVHSRVEALAPAVASIIVSRAFASLSDFVRMTRPQLVRDGVWVAMKGKRPEHEITKVAEHARVFHVERLEPPGVIGERCLVWMHTHGDGLESASRR